MAFIVNGYVCRVKAGFVGKTARHARNWWLVKHHSNPRIKTGMIHFSNLYFPKELVGKRIRLKVEVVEDGF